MAKNKTNESLKVEKLDKNIEKCFVSRDLSWLEFNKRVLMLANDIKVPLVERLKFLSIYNSNLDEFFMVRVGSLSHRAKYLPGLKDIKTGRTADEEVKLILAEVSEQQKSVKTIYDNIIQDFKNEGIEKVNFAHLSKADETIVKKVFTEYKDFLSPRVIDNEHPIPFLTNEECYLAALLEKGNETKLGIVSLYRLPKYLKFESGSTKQKVVVVSELINYYIQSLFKKYTVREKCAIRVTRNADVFFEDYEKEYEGDSRFDMKKLLKKRKRELPVRLQISGKPSEAFIEILKEKVKISSKETFISNVPFDINFQSVIDSSPKLKYASKKPVKNVEIKKGELFKYLEKKDLLLSFPYQSINPFIDLLYEAADDPEVMSICITLYRLSPSSKIAAALAYAADKGKDVVCLMELRARFDEQNNIDFSEVLEEAGCSIIYGFPELKVHSKLCLITRNTSSGIKYITQVGTGNYNEITSELYTDLSFITSNEQIGKEAAEVFNSIKTGIVPERADHLITAPMGFKPIVLELLDREMRKGEKGRVSIKVNSMNDVDVMKKLIECSQAGVKVDLFIRGICCLKPRIAGYTDKIRVKSIVGRYLEHSRIFMFGSEKDDDFKVIIGSGDLLNRNTSRRVEAFADVTKSNILPNILEVMNAFDSDVDNSWIMQPEGNYLRLPGGTGQDNFERLSNYFEEDKIEPIKKGIFGKLFAR